MDSNFPPDPNKWGRKYYACRNCDREINFSMCDYMSGIREDQTFLILYKCWCYPGKELDDAFRVDPDALRRFLRGMRPILPYRAAPGNSLPLTDEQEKLLRVFSWECYMLESVEEMLLLASRTHQP